MVIFLSTVMAEKGGRVSRGIVLLTKSMMGGKTEVMWKNLPCRGKETFASAFSSSSSSFSSPPDEDAAEDDEEGDGDEGDRGGDGNRAVGAATFPVLIGTGRSMGKGDGSDVTGGGKRGVLKGADENGRSTAFFIRSFSREGTLGIVGGEA